MSKVARDIFPCKLLRVVDLTSLFMRYFTKAAAFGEGTANGMDVTFSYRLGGTLTLHVRRLLTIKF
jgi:hypothetical protein